MKDQTIIKKLHVQLSFFLTSVTGTILIILTLFCLFISESGIRKNTLYSFRNERDAIITHLQTQTSFSLQWINQVQENNRLYLYLYDNGMPILGAKLYSTQKKDALVSDVLAYAKSKHHLDITKPAYSVLPIYYDFTITDTDDCSYFVSAGVVSKEKSALGYVLLYPLSRQSRQIVTQRILFAGVDAVAVCLLFLFSRIFIQKMLRPLEENRKNQIHFTASASHELRAPLAVILSSAEAMRKADTQREQLHFLQMIQSEGVRMQRLIADLLLLTHSDSGTLPMHVTDCQPDLLLIDAYEKYELAAADKQIAFSIQLPKEDLPVCRADAERILQLLSILLDNALSYTPNGGAIWLSLDFSVQAAKKFTAVHCFEFRVADNGVSIPDSQKELIFERFYRAQNSHTDKQHFGLGLCIAKEIVNAHHGKIWVEDTPGGGVCFCFQLIQNQASN